MFFFEFSNLLRQYLLVATVNLCIITCGISFAWPSPILVKLNDPEQSPLPGPITDNQGSWIVSAGFLCGPIVTLFGGSLLDSYGRKRCLLFLYIPKVLMGVFLIFATEVWMLIFSRALMLTADVFIIIVIPVYVSELASKEYRGVLGTLLQLFSSFGELVSYSVGPFTSYTLFNIIFTSIIVLTFVPILYFVPESPTFLYSKGREEESLKVLTYLRGSALKAKEEVDNYKFLVKKTNESVKKLTLFKNKTFRKSFALGCLIGLGAQFAGFNAVTFYLQTILISTNTSLRSETSSVILGVIQVLASFCSHAVTSSRFGRKTILCMSFSGICIGMFGLGIFFKLSEPKGYVVSGFLNYLPLICLILVIVCYVAGIGSILWVVVAEIFDDESRAFGVSCTMSLTVFLIFLISKYFPLVTNSIGPPATYWTFSAFNIVMIVLVVLFLPETKGKSFAEIQTALGGKRHATEKAVTVATGPSV